MLRSLIGIKRNTDEDWLGWVHRATTHARSLAEQAGCKCWIHTYLAQRWRWAGCVARMKSTSWPSRLTFWRDVEWQ
eukprot:10132605-Karenia_brevis.AAC.1